MIADFLADKRKRDISLAVQWAEMREERDALKAERDALRAFVAAYDTWALSEREGLGGPLTEAMLEARDALEEWCEQAT